MSLEIPSPILMIGDPYLAKNGIVIAKKKYKNAHWETVNATTQSLDEIRMISCFSQFGVTDKIVVVQDIPNKKQVREFILDLVSSSTNSLKFIVWDSNNHIKIDPKTKEIMKTWAEFYDKIKCMPNSKIINHGEDFSEKESMNSITYVQDCFSKFGKKISDRSAMVFIDMVGKNRGMLYSEAKKIAINCPDNISESFIVDNVFPSSTEAVLYKFGNIIDKGNIEQSIIALEDFIAHGANEYVLSEILMKKARWQLAVAELWANADLQFHEISSEIMLMGKFPSISWHDRNMSDNAKKNYGLKFNTSNTKVEFLVEKLGFPEYMFKVEKEKEKKKKDDEEVKKEKCVGEVIPMQFMAQQIVDFVKKIVDENSKIPSNELKNKVLDRALYTYLNISELMKSNRYDQKDTKQNLYEMVKLLNDFTLNKFEIE